MRIMMGSKQRHFAPLINVSLEELVPQDHFYRHLERTLDLSFVREFVQEKYAGKGRPSIDPIIGVAFPIHRRYRITLSPASHTNISPHRTTTPRY
jgi:hypothetical protein